MPKCSRCKATVNKPTDSYAPYKYAGGIFCKGCETWVKRAIEEGKLPAK